MTPKTAIISTLMIIGLIAGCNKVQDFNNEVVWYEDIQTYDKTTIAMLPVELDEMLMKPLKLWSRDSVLIIYDNGYPENGVVRGYNLPSGELCFHDVVIGNGPGEYILPGFMQIGDSILVYSLKGQWDLLFVNENRSGSTISKIEQKPLGDKQLYTSNYLFPVNDTLIVANQSGEYQFTCYNRETDNSRHLNNFPEQYSVSDFVLNTSIFNAFYAMGGNRKIVVAYQYYPIIDIVSPLNNFITKRIIFKNKFQNQFEEIDEFNARFIDPKLQYTFAHCNRDFFYVLYQNSDRETLKHNRQAPEIHKFSWDGTFVGRMVPNRPIYNFTVSADDEYLYGLGFDEDLEPQVYMGEL
jgi:hypothetical protein